MVDYLTCIHPVVFSGKFCDAISQQLGNQLFQNAYALYTYIAPLCRFRDPNKSEGKERDRTQWWKKLGECSNACYILFVSLQRHSARYCVTINVDMDLVGEH